MPPPWINPVWIVYALLAALFAALTSVLAKLGIQDVNSHLATAIRTLFVLVASWGMVFLLGEHRGTAALSGRNWLLLALSGLATGASWLFYYRAVQIGRVSQVASVDKLSIVFTFLLAFLVLGEPMKAKAIAGCLLIAAGALVISL